MATPETKSVVTPLAGKRIEVPLKKESKSRRLDVRSGSPSDSSDPTHH